VDVKADAAEAVRVADPQQATVNEVGNRLVGEAAELLGSLGPLPQPWHERVGPLDQLFARDGHGRDHDRLLLASGVERCGPASGFSMIRAWVNARAEPWSAALRLCSASRWDSESWRRCLG